MALQKQDAPHLCGEIWRRCFVSLTVNTTPIRNEEAKLFTSSYDNFIQTAGIRDGASHSAKVLSVFYDSLEGTDTSTRLEDLHSASRSCVVPIVERLWSV
jgi:hypothetical protein